MKKITFIILLLITVSPLTNAATTAFGLSLGIADSKSIKDGKRFTAFDTYSVYMAINSQHNWPIEFGYSQLADMEYKGNTINQRTSFQAPYFAVKRLFQIGDSYYSYVKVGIVYWMGEYKETENKINAVEEQLYSTKGNGLSPYIGVGVDMVFDQDLGYRVEFEHIPVLGDGMYDDNSTINSGETLITKGFSYTRLVFGLVVAF